MVKTDPRVNKNAPSLVVFVDYFRGKTPEPERRQWTASRTRPTTADRFALYLRTVGIDASICMYMR